MYVCIYVNECVYMCLYTSAEFCKKQRKDKSESDKTDYLKKMG